MNQATGRPPAATDAVEGLLADLETIATIARAGVISRTEHRLHPAETRPAAILYFDVVGFTALARRLTSEQLTTLIDRTFRVFELTVKAQGGYLDKVIGDAALYVFAGHPNYPSPCEGALNAALKLLERAQQVSRSLGASELALAVRIGVSFGEVTRQAVGGEAMQLTVMGEVVNLAQRLEATAQPGTVHTVREVLEQAGGRFSYEPLGARELKGFGAVETFRVTDVEPAAVGEAPVSVMRLLVPVNGQQELNAVLPAEPELLLVKQRAVGGHGERELFTVALRLPLAIVHRKLHQVKGQQRLPAEEEDFRARQVAGLEQQEIHRSLDHFLSHPPGTLAVNEAVITPAVAVLRDEHVYELDGREHTFSQQLPKASTYEALLVQRGLVE